MMNKSTLLLSALAITAASNADVLTSRASLATGGAQVFARSFDAKLNQNGAYVVYVSSATTLVPGDSNGFDDVFVHDRFWGSTTRVSIGNGNVQANNHSFSPAISSDGRYIAFASHATNLVPGDTNGATDVFLHDRMTGTTTRVSTDSTGVQGNKDSNNPSLGGNLVCFDSNSDNLVAGDSNLLPDVFTKSISTGETRMESLSFAGVQGNSMSHQGRISAGGTHIAFVSHSTNLVEMPDTNQNPDVFIRDRIGGGVHLASLGANMQGSNGQNSNPEISADGRFVAFESSATNLVSSGDSNGQRDVFLRDSACWFTQMMSVSSSQEQGNGMSANPAISHDGRFVSFFTFSTNLVPDPLAFNENIVTRDTWNWTTSLSSVNTAGQSTNYVTTRPAISGDGRFVAYQSFANNLVPMDTNAMSDIFVTDTEATATPASQYNLIRGIEVGGSLLSLSASDDNRLVIRPGVTFTTAQDPIEVYFIGQVPNNIAEFEVLVEASASSGNIRQRLEIFDFNICTFVDLGSMALSPLDAVQGGQPVGEMSTYASSGMVWIRATYRQTGPVFAYPWSARIDQVRFVASE